MEIIGAERQNIKVANLNTKHSKDAWELSRESHRLKHLYQQPDGSGTAQHHVAPALKAAHGDGPRFDGDDGDPNNYADYWREHFPVHKFSSGAERLLEMLNHGYEPTDAELDQAMDHLQAY